MKPIERAIEAVGGRQIVLASAISVSPQAISQWVAGTRPIPPAKCIPIEAATSGVVTRYDLRPDIFGADPATPDTKPAAKRGRRAA